MKHSLKSAAAIVVFSAASVAITNPAHALKIGGSVSFTTAGSSQLTASFSDETPVIEAGADPNFTMMPSGPSIKDLVLTQIGFTQASNPETEEFITGFQYQGADAFFTLNSGTDTIPVVFGGHTGVLDFTFDGVIRSVMDSSLLASVTGTLSAAERTINGTVVNNEFSVDLAATPVPTPALLPGLIGMGVAFVRKRRAASEQSV